MKATELYTPVKSAEQYYFRVLRGGRDRLVCL